MLLSIVRVSRGVFCFVALLMLVNCPAQGAFVFHGTSNSSQWQVAIAQLVGPLDSTPIEKANFPTTGFNTATSIGISGRGEWIANNSSGTNGGFQITLFTFRQTFDLSGFDPGTAELQFNWAADDSGEGYASRGTWKPAFSLNGGPVVQGVWPGNLSYNPELHTISSGFVSGLNIIEFYVEGNGVTDGLLIKNVLSAAAPITAAVPEPTSAALFGIGLFAVGAANVRRKKGSGLFSVSTKKEA